VEVHEKYYNCGIVVVVVVVVVVIVVR